MAATKVATDTNKELRISMTPGTTSVSTSHSSETAFPLLAEILEEIFLNLPPGQVVCVCQLVCKKWKEVADQESFWRERCRREGCHLHDASSDWRQTYFWFKEIRNLLKNPRGENAFQGWTITENGGDRWKVEEPLKPHPKEEVQMNFVTSYGLCMKTQVIDLEKEGYVASSLDRLQPPIRISDWYAPRCRCEYRISVQLLNHRKRVVQDFTPEPVYLPQFDQLIGEHWYQVTHVFKDYGRGVRYIRFSHGGQDNVFWAGWYGVRVTDSCVQVVPALAT